VRTNQPNYEFIGLA